MAATEFLLAQYRCHRHGVLRVSKKMPEVAGEYTNIYQIGKFHLVYIHDVDQDRYEVSNNIRCGVYSTV